ncbi:hypothetical protein AAHC03_09892 [Spirometra sp. Aus1]
MRCHKKVESPSGVQPPDHESSAEVVHSVARSPSLPSEAVRYEANQTAEYRRLLANTRSTPAWFDYWYLGPMTR